MYTCYLFNTNGNEYNQHIFTFKKKIIKGQGHILSYADPSLISIINNIFTSWTQL